MPISLRKITVFRRLVKTNTKSNITLTICSCLFTMSPLFAEDAF